MIKFVFDCSEVRDLAQPGGLINDPANNMPLILMIDDDQGVYLIRAATPEEDPAAPDKVAYARGYDPNTNPNIAAATAGLYGNEKTKAIRVPPVPFMILEELIGEVEIEVDKDSTMVHVTFVQKRDVVADQASRDASSRKTLH